MLTRLILQNYRNYPYSQWIFDKFLIFLCGNNGTGKTNILEAISLLNAPKGLRSTDVKDLGLYDNEKKQHADWTIFCDLSGQPASITNHESKKTIRLNQKIITQRQLNEHVGVFWIAPENDRLFSGTPSDRRAFINHLIELTDSEYGPIHSQYMHFIHERNQILHMPNPDSIWLDQLETKIVDLALKIYETRTAFITTLNTWIKQLDHFHYHHFEMEDGPYEDLADQIRSNRNHDQIRGGCRVGPHKSDLIGYRENMSLHLCSNGQQCIGLFSILLGLVKQYSQKKPILFLVDEVFSHLDKKHQDLLVQELKSIPSLQTFISLPHTTTFPGAQIIQL